MWPPTQTWLKSQNSHRGDEWRLSGIGWGLRYITAPWLAYSGPALEEVYSTQTWHSYSTVQLVMLHQICIKCQRKNPIFYVSLAELLRCYAELKRSVNFFCVVHFQLQTDGLLQHCYEADVGSSSTHRDNVTYLMIHRCPKLHVAHADQSEALLFGWGLLLTKMRRGNLDTKVQRHWCWLFSNCSKNKSYKRTFSTGGFLITTYLF